MARPPRIEYDGAWHHVMNRGTGRRRIFHDDKDREKFLKLLGDLRKIWNVEVHAYSLMPNHYHLLLHTPNSHLSRSMRYLGAEYTQYYNRRFKNDGALFRGRFKSIVAEEESYLLALVRYIHLNPVKAGLCRRPEEHPWTSHFAYLDKKNRPSWLVTDNVLDKLSKNETKATRRLKDYVESESDTDIGKIIEVKRRTSILGSEGFRDWIKDNLLENVRRERKIPATRSVKRCRIGFARILEYVAGEFHVTKRLIVAQTGRQANEPKSVTMELYRRLNGATHGEIAKMFGATTQAVAKNLQRLRMRCQEDESLSERLDAYSKSLLSYVQS